MELGRISDLITGFGDAEEKQKASMAIDKCPKSASDAIYDNFPQ